jgi:hypothetical protein
MHRRLPARIVMALLALLMMLGGVRGVAARCLDDGCKMPCCDADDVNTPSIRPVLACCRIMTAQDVPRQQAPTVEPAADSLAILTPARVWLRVDRSPTPRGSAAPLPVATAPPVYERHCARLL